MSTTAKNTDRDDQAGLPAFPAERAARCPLDPPPAYADWRKAEGLQRAVRKNGGPVWVVSRYEDVRAALADPRLSSDSRNPNSPQHTPGNDIRAVIHMDAPEHAEHRRMLAGEFTVKRLNAWRPGIEKVVNQFLDEMISKGRPADLVQEFALPVPSMVICLMLGVPYSDHAFFQERSAYLVNPKATPEEVGRASVEILQYMGELVERKEREPGDDILSRQVHDYVLKGDMTRERAALNGLTLLVAGHETTSNMIGLSVVALLKNPEIAARIREADNRATAANAVEELLRYLSIAITPMHRVATEDLTIGGQLIRAGEVVTVNLPAANRDSAFLADADTLDIDRSTRGHVAFGHGPHQCLGQNLARIEMEIALPALLRRLPGLRIAVPEDQIEYRHDMNTYGVHALPVTW
ncbi:cytochrome P450 [Streptomyces olindensis]|uniref:cytochrome P450 n=1 Tax=Streptomyces olindensis TaxID=358823 RepID=UPI003681EF1E